MEHLTPQAIEDIGNVLHENLQFYDDSGRPDNKTFIAEIERTLALVMGAKPKGKPGFHVISLKRSKKLQRLHNVLLSATEPLSSLELTRRTNLVALSTWASHLRANGIKLANEQRTENGQQVWYWWIEHEKTTTSVHGQAECSASV